MEQQNNIERIWILMARKLSAEASEIELAELEQLLRQQPEENYSLEIMQDLWKSQAKIDRPYSENEYKALIYRLRQMGIDDGRFDEQDHYINNEGQESQVQTKKKKYFLLYGALLIVALSAGLFFYNRQAQKEEQPAGSVAKNEISTKYGSKTSLVLPDGTKVWLNAGSKLTYDKNYAGSLREVSLVGEAYFDVVKDPRKPFIIHTSKMDIKVLGTVFNVKCYPDDKHTETSLVKGSIEVTLKDRTDKIILKPNEKLIITDNEPSEKKSAAEGKKEEAQEPMIALSHLTREPVNNDIIETSWVDNKLVFNSETFEEIVIKMQRWYGVEIRLNNEKIKQKRFTGTFENETVDQALAAMQLTMPFTYVIKKDHIIISQ
jgi:transmembrane sensor